MSSQPVPEADIEGVHCMKRRRRRGGEMVRLRRGMRAGNYVRVYRRFL